MTLRGRLTAMSALVVGVILAIGSVLCFVVMRHQLRGQIDDQLVQQARLVQDVTARAPIGLARPPARGTELPHSSSAGTAPFAQFVRTDGRVFAPGGTSLPVGAADRAIARRGRGEVLSDRTVDGHHLRVMTAGVNGGAVQLGRPMGSVDSALSRLRLVLAILAAGGIALAAVASRLFSRSVLSPIDDLSRATQHIRATGDLDRRVDEGRTDEVGLLAANFNAMLARLQTAQQELNVSTAAQRQLVADASHELRTPVASLRTNVEVLLSDDAIDPDSRRALMADVVEQTEELTAVVADLIELARGDRPQDDLEDLDLADIVRAALARAERHAPQLRYEAILEPWAMTGSRERLGRAINNLLDNAAKFSPSGSTVHVWLHGGELTVRDEGPGVADEDLPHIFDRFFRAGDAAPHLGSGLGLAIVQQVVTAHDGTVEARRHPDGGLEVTMRFAPAAAFGAQPEIWPAALARTSRDELPT
jgi:two-component system sensor histidine kinase MprB